MFWIDIGKISIGNTAPDKNSMITAVNKNWAPQPISGNQKVMELTINKITKYKNMAIEIVNRNPLRYAKFVWIKKGGLRIK